MTLDSKYKGQFGAIWTLDWVLSSIVFSDAIVFHWSMYHPNMNFSFTEFCRLVMMQGNSWSTFILILVLVRQLVFLVLCNSVDLSPWVNPHCLIYIWAELPERSYGADCRIYVPDHPKSRFNNVYVWWLHSPTYFPFYSILFLIASG